MFENVAFERCSPSSGQHIVEVDRCDSASLESSVVLNNVTFRRNRLEDASALYVGRPSCLGLEMTSVTFVDNICSRDCFGRLSMRNVLRNIEMHRNADAQLKGHNPSLLSLPPGSVTEAVRCDVSYNNVTAFKAENATLLVSASVFEKNRGRTVLLLKLKTEATLRNCTFRRNASGTNSSGGAVHLAYAQLTRVTDSVFEENRGRKGGAIFIDHGTLDVDGCTFAGNEVTGNVRNSGGAIFAIGSTLNLNASTYLNNFSDKLGGAIHAEDSFLHMSDENFIGNAARDQGGAVYLIEVVDFWIERTTFSGGVANDGGALFVSTSSGRVEECAFLRNVAGKGGALRLAFMSTMDVTSTRFSHNRANESNGGGVLVAEESTMSMSETILRLNEAKQNGGAVMLDSTSVMFGHQVTIENNRGDLSGGGIHVTKQSHLVLSKSRLIGNWGDFGGALHVTENSGVSTMETLIKGSHAEKNGGGLFIDRESTALLRRTQFRVNSANQSGAGIRCSTYAKVFGIGLTIEKNQVVQFGGGIFAKHHCVVHLNSSFITDNISEDLGGGIYFHDVKNARFENVVLQRNRAIEGGGFYLKMAAAEIKASSFVGDVAEKGGSIAAKGSSGVIVEASHFRDGSAGSAGGCLFVDEGSNAKLNRVVMTSCVSKRGGGIFVKSSSLTAEHLTTNACYARSGGGIFAEPDSAIRCSSSRFEGNSADKDGGAVSIVAAEPQGLTYQFFLCRFLQNKALLGGEYTNIVCVRRVTASTDRGDSFAKREGQQKLRRSCSKLHIRCPCQERIRRQHRIGWRSHLRQLSQGFSLQLLRRHWEAAIQQSQILVVSADRLATSVVWSEEQHCHEFWRLCGILCPTSACVDRKQPNRIVHTMERYFSLSQRSQEWRSPSRYSFECDGRFRPRSGLWSMATLRRSHRVIARQVFRRTHHCAFYQRQGRYLWHCHDEFARKLRGEDRF